MILPNSGQISSLFATFYDINLKSTSLTANRNCISIIQNGNGKISYTNPWDHQDKKKVVKFIPWFTNTHTLSRIIVPNMHTHQMLYFVILSWDKIESTSTHILISIGVYVDTAYYRGKVVHAVHIRCCSFFSFILLKYIVIFKFCIGHISNNQSIIRIFNILLMFSY